MDLVHGTLTRALAALERGEVSSEELTRSLVAQARRVQPQLNAFIRIDEEEALALLVVHAPLEKIVFAIRRVGDLHQGGKLHQGQAGGHRVELVGGPDHQLVIAGIGRR